MMDERTQEEPQAWDAEGATHRADFKIEELVEFVRAASSSEEEFKTPLKACMRHLIRRQRKWRKDAC